MKCAGWGLVVCVWGEGGWPCVSWLPHPPPSSSFFFFFWIDAGIPGAIFSLSVVESRAWEERERERERRGSGKRKRSSGWMGKRERWKKEKRGERGERGGICMEGGGFPCGLQLQQHPHTKLHAVRALNRDQTARKKQKRERRVPLRAPPKHTHGHTEGERQISLWLYLVFIYILVLLIFFFFKHQS